MARQRGMAKKPPLEDTIKRKLVSQMNQVIGCRAKRVAGGMMSVGNADITACYFGHRIELEVKRVKGQRPTDIQQYELDQWAAAGASTGCVTCWEDVYQILQAIRPVRFKTNT